MGSKNAAIVAQVRQEIVGGHFPPGSRLPSQLEMAERFGVAGLTVQTALKELAREGFVEARSRSGTFVVEQPPHLNNYGLVFIQDPHGPFARSEWSHYHQALAQAAVHVEKTMGRRVLQFHGIDQHADSPGRQRLLKLVETHRLAGLIFANSPFLLEGSPILEAPGLPRVMLGKPTNYAQVRTVDFGGGQWLPKALDYLAALGRRRVATIEFRVTPLAEPTQLLAELAAREMVTQPRWRQFATTTLPEAARHAAELLMHDREPPDALLVMDDNYVEAAQAGLAAAGVRVPDDVAVVGHANYPTPPAKMLPIRLLGYDHCAILESCIGLIDNWRAGTAAPVDAFVPALWEEEVEKRRF